MKQNIAEIKSVNGRNAVVRSVSMQPEEWLYIHRRVNELHPKVATRSQYFQLLAFAERQGIIDIHKIMGMPSSSLTEPSELLVDEISSKARKRQARKQRS